MSEIDKIRELFASFEKTGSLVSLAEAIEITEDLLENSENVKDKEIARKCFNLYKKKQLEEARRILKEEDDFRKVDECWQVLDEFSEVKLANSSEDIVELEKIKNELLMKEFECHIDSREGDWITFKKNSPLNANNYKSYMRDWAKRFVKEAPDS